MNGQKAQISTKDLSMAEELMDFQSLLYTKSKYYAQTLSSDQEAQQILCRIADTHKACFSDINTYLQGSN